MRVLIIVSPVISIKKEKRSIIKKIAHQITRCSETVDITYIKKPGEGKEIASRACFERYDFIYGAGGDGTINDVASGLIQRNVPLGIIPLGTGNGLARSLGIPFDSKSIIEIQLNKKITTIDTGKISNRIFLSTAGIGYDAKIAYDFNTLKILKRTFAKYIYFAVTYYFFYKTEELTLFVDDMKLERTIFGLTVCNTSQYGSGAIIAPQANPRSGKLIAVLIPKLTVTKTLLSAKKLFNGSIEDIKELEYIPFKNQKIIRRQADLIQVDGEHFRGNATFKVSVVPSSLKIITP